MGFIRLGIIEELKGKRKCLQNIRILRREWPRTVTHQKKTKGGEEGDKGG